MSMHAFSVFLFLSDLQPTDVVVHHPYFDKRFRICVRRSLECEAVL